MDLYAPIFKRLNVIIFAIASTFILLDVGFSQDIHFSQMHAVPLSINPSTAGVSETDIRLTNDYRNQWYKVDYPFHTLYLAIDGKLKLLNRPCGIGAMLIHDQSSSLYFTSEKFYATLSHSFFYRNHQFVVGAQPGVVLKHYNSNNITFGNQFDSDAETFNPNLPSNEDLLIDRISYFDLNLGAIWRSRIKNIFTTVGVSFHHVNQPLESFFQDNDSTRLPVKYTIHGDVAFPIADKLEIKPMVLYSTMKGANEFLGGVTTSYYPMLPDLIVKKIYALASFRINPVRNIDALILGGGVTVSSLDICISYDITVSSLRKASNYQGAFEISLMMNINKRAPSGITEPCIML
jgi:type IX secretion system PorP/SprF family membrane protein